MREWRGMCTDRLGHFNHRPDGHSPFRPGFLAAAREQLAKLKARFGTSRTAFPLPAMLLQVAEGEEHIL